MLVTDYESQLFISENRLKSSMVNENRMRYN